MRISPFVPLLGFALGLAASPASAQSVVPTPVSPLATPWQDARPPAASPAEAADHAAAADARAVEGLLATLDADAQERRTLGLAVGLGGGGAVTGLGAWMLLRGDAPRWHENTGLYVGAAGVGLILGGVLTAVLPAYLHELRDAWRTTAGLPTATRRAHFGVILDELADRAHAARMFSGRLSLGVGAAFVTTAAVLFAAREDSSTALFPAELVAGVVGALLMATSVPTLTVRSPIEHARMFWRAGAARPAVRLAGVSVQPTRGGVVGGLALTF